VYSATILAGIAVVALIVWKSLNTAPELFASIQPTPIPIAATEAPMPVQAPMSAAVLPQSQVPPEISTTYKTVSASKYHRAIHRKAAKNKSYLSTTWQRPGGDTPEFIRFNGGPAPDYENIYGNRGPIDDNTRAWIDRQNRTSMVASHATE